eukprot:3106333-Pleurochrysis_carterae.AAC.1
MPHEGPLLGRAAQRDLLRSPGGRTLTDRSAQTDGAAAEVLEAAPLHHALVAGLRAGRHLQRHLPSTQGTRRIESAFEARKGGGKTAARRSSEQAAHAEAQSVIPKMQKRQHAGAQD